MHETTTLLGDGVVGYGVYGGIGLDMERTGDLWSLDLKSSPAFKSFPAYRISESSIERPGPSPRSHFGQPPQPQSVPAGSSGYAANSSSIQIRAPAYGTHHDDGSSSALTAKFVWKRLE